ncbi:hypothetical protein OYE22_17360 [Streptomyces sp. 71268]|uniref:hypothetical protein n=1 Tax=Streptomyces sp. 71268 TaxID=3002640 RepID=UPI0023F9B9AE|nr:hypothetical protein [Streptomyces sp. 71268]WEV26770.1 hypothetical protein OYE22_17360 [Streptomyces sp. 71268]
MSATSDGDHPDQCGFPRHGASQYVGLGAAINGASAQRIVVNNFGSTCHPPCTHAAPPGPPAPLTRALTLTRNLASRIDALAALAHTTTAVLLALAPTGRRPPKSPSTPTPGAPDRTGHRRADHRRSV